MPLLALSRQLLVPSVEEYCLAYVRKRWAGAGGLWVCQEEVGGAL